MSDRVAPLRRTLQLATLCAAALAGGTSVSAQEIRAVPYDIVIRGGLVYDGEGNAPVRADVGIRGDRIVAVGRLAQSTAKREIDARGLAVAPGFIDTISFSWDVLPADPRALSNVYQGVTLEVFAEGESPGPLTPQMREELKTRQYQYRFDVPWSSLGDYLSHLEKKGAGVNFASYVGASTVRRNVLQESIRAATTLEIAQMQEIVRQAMREGALGLGAGLSTAPGSFMTQEELIALASAAGESGGLMEVALRSQSLRALEAIDEAIEIARRAHVHLEIGHLYQSGAQNWPKIDAVLARLEAARKQGIGITASVYTYTEVWTGLSSTLPPWAHDGGLEKLIDRMRDPAQRERAINDMRNWNGSGWEQYLALAGTPENVFLLKLENDLRQFQGKTLADVMRTRGAPSAEAAAVDLVRDSGNEVWTAFRTESEDNLRRLIREPWVNLGSDSSSIATEGVHLAALVHPRTYGNTARLLSRYVRDEKLITLQEAVRRLTSLPARTLKLDGRGTLAVGSYADVVVFDPAKVRDLSTFAKPHQYSTGMRHVLVNGVAVLSDGRHTGALPGRAVRGPGYVQRRS